MKLIPNINLEAITTKETPKTNYFYVEFNRIIEQQKKKQKPVNDRIINLYEHVHEYLVSLDTLARESFLNEGLTTSLTDKVLDILNSDHSENLRKQGLPEDLLKVKKALGNYYTAKSLLILKTNKPSIVSSKSKISLYYVSKTTDLFKILLINPVLRSGSLLASEIKYMKSQLNSIGEDANLRILSELQGFTQEKLEIEISAQELLEQLDPNHAFRKRFAKKKSKLGLKNIPIYLDINKQFCKNLDGLIPYIAFNIDNKNHKQSTHGKNANKEVRLLNMNLAHLMNSLANLYDSKLVLKRIPITKVYAPIMVFDRISFGFYDNRRFQNQYSEIPIGKGYEVFLREKNGKERFINKIYFPENIVSVNSIAHLSGSNYSSSEKVSKILDDINTNR